jgi:hypothetical protein
LFYIESDLTLAAIAQGLVGVADAAGRNITIYDAGTCGSTHGYVAGITNGIQSWGLDAPSDVGYFILPGGVPSVANVTCDAYPVLVHGDVVLRGVFTAGAMSNFVSGVPDAYAPKSNVALAAVHSGLIAWPQPGRAESTGVPYADILWVHRAPQRLTGPALFRNQILSTGWGSISTPVECFALRITSALLPASGSSNAEAPSVTRVDVGRWYDVRSDGSTFVPWCGDACSVVGTTFYAPISELRSAAVHAGLVLNAPLTAANAATAPSALYVHASSTVRQTFEFFGSHRNGVTSTVFGDVSGLVASFGVGLTAAAASLPAETLEILNATSQSPVPFRATIAWADVSPQCYGAGVFGGNLNMASWGGGFFFDGNAAPTGLNRPDELKLYAQPLGLTTTFPAFSAVGPGFCRASDSFGIYVPGFVLGRTSESAAATAVAVNLSASRVINMAPPQNRMSYEFNVTLPRNASIGTFSTYYALGAGTYANAADAAVAAYREGLADFGKTSPVARIVVAVASSFYPLAATVRFVDGNSYQTTFLSSMWYENTRTDYNARTYATGVQLRAIYLRRLADEPAAVGVYSWTNTSTVLVQPTAADLWGLSIGIEGAYHFASSVATSALHMGLVSLGGAADATRAYRVFVFTPPSQSQVQRFFGSTRNGVVSQSTLLVQGLPAFNLSLTAPDPQWWTAAALFFEDFRTTVECVSRTPVALGNAA